MGRERLANLLGAASVGIRDRVGAAMSARVGLGETATAALLTVHSRPGRSIDALAGSLGLTHSATVRVADRLAAQGLVERRRGRDDRTVALHATRRGRSVAASALQARRTALAALLGDLDEDDATVLEDLLARVLATLPYDRADAQRICRLCEHEVCRGGACPVGAAVAEDC